MNIIKGFPATSQNSFQLNVTNILKHGSRNFGKQEIVSKKHDGTLFRYTYKDAYERAQRLANSLLFLGIEVGDLFDVSLTRPHLDLIIRLLIYLNIE